MVRLNKVVVRYMSDFICFGQIPSLKESRAGLSTSLDAVTFVDIYWGSVTLVCLVMRVTTTQGEDNAALFLARV